MAFASFFGAGYNEKTYNVNTANFKNQLTAIYSNLSLRGVKAPGVSKAITSLISTLDRIPFPKGKDKKKQKQVDEYMIGLIDDMALSAQKSNTAKLTLQAKMLNDLIFDARLFGQLHCPIEDLKRCEILNDNLGELNQVSITKADLAKRKTEIEKEAERLDALGAEEEIVPLDNEYARIEAEEQALSMKESELRATYDYNCRAIATAKDREFYQRLAAGNFIAVQPQEIVKIAEEINQAIETNREKIGIGSEVLDELYSEHGKGHGAVGASSSLRNKLEAKKAASTIAEVENAEYTPESNGSPVSSLRQKLNDQK